MLGVEIWNEPNFLPAFEPRGDPARYVQLLQAARRPVKSVAPKTPAVSGGLFPTPTTGKLGMADYQFLAGMYAAGVKGLMDGIGAHPYPYANDTGAPVRWDPAAMERVLRRLREVRDAAGDRETPVWITAMGLSTANAPGYPPAVSDAQQAHDLMVMLRELLHDHDVRVVLSFGVLRYDDRPKPAACALSQAFHGRVRCPS